MNKRKFEINPDGHFTVKNVLIRYVDISGLSTQRANEEIYRVENEYFHEKRLQDIYAHVEIIRSDKNEIDIKQLYGKAKYTFKRK